MSDELDIKIHFLISAIDIAMTFAILKTELFPKSVSSLINNIKDINEGQNNQKNLEKRRNKRRFERLPACLS